MYLNESLNLAMFSLLISLKRNHKDTRGGGAHISFGYVDVPSGRASSFTILV